MEVLQPILDSFVLRDPRGTTVALVAESPIPRSPQT